MENQAISLADYATGFLPIEASDSRVLILGSLPGQASIDAQQYYAHPRNAFWPIMKALFAAEGDYTDRCRSLKDSGVSVWDVLRQSHRPGSLDSNIRASTASPNDFVSFFRRHAGLRLVACNGAKAHELFTKFVELPESVELVRLPSTSPAHAALSLEEKLKEWRSALSDFVEVREC